MGYEDDSEQKRRIEIAQQDMAKLSGVALSDEARALLKQFTPEGVADFGMTAFLVDYIRAMESSIELLRAAAKPEVETRLKLFQELATAWETLKEHELGD